MKPWKGDKKLRWFEEILRRDVDESVLELSSVEFELMNRIELVEQMGELGLLKLDEISSEELMDRVQSELFRQIHQYREYEEPVNECIRHTEDMPQSRWNLLEQRLDEKIADAGKREYWEQCLMVDMEMPLRKWECQEETLFDAISGFERNETWEKAAKGDEVSQPVSAEKQEMAFEEMLAKTDQLPDWEKCIRCEFVQPCSFWEKAERKLFDRIERQGDGMKLARQPFWFLIEFYMGRLKAASVGVAAVMLLLASLWGGAHFLRDEEQVPTLVYQVQGAIAEKFDFAALGRTHFSSEAGDVLTLVNKHGFMELQNGLSVQIEYLSRSRARYRINRKESSEVSASESRVVFFAKKRDSRKQFAVSTPDYSLEVTGTYFSVEPDQQNRFCTKVFEGSVKINDGERDVELKAGQSYSYSSSSGEYVVRSGGKVIPRDQIEQVPDVEEIRKYRLLKIRSATPGSVVRIDGRYYGTTPLALYQAVGDHRIQVVKDGYTSVDTVVTIGSDSVYTVNVVLAEIREEEEEMPRRPRPVRKNVPLVRSTEPEVIHEESRSVSEDEPEDNSAANYRLAREEELDGDYRNAIRLYESVFDNQNAKKVHREDALFSIGKLKAEHGSGAQAREVFLEYLAFFPDGLFAGESWLRLAELEFGRDQEKALEYYHKYLERFPSHHRTSELQNRVGLIYLQMGRSEEAAAMFRAALSSMRPAQKKERKNILLNLHNALKACGDEKNSDRVWRKYLTEVNTPGGR
ncbi:MAG: PEGA domain-containing protein [Chitinispirillaceae bacterium]